MEGVYCYECNETFSGSSYTEQYNSEQCRLCPTCGTDFVEIVETPPLNSPSGAAVLPSVQPVSSTGASTASNNLSDFPHGVQPLEFTHETILPGGNGRLSVRVIAAPVDPANLSAELPGLLTEALEPGASVFGVQVNSNGTFGAPVRLNLNNLEYGSSWEELLDQLAQLHQPAADPASRDVVAALPKLEVPISQREDSVRARQQTARADGRQAFAACSAGEPCSVCHTEFEAGEQVTQLHCSHCFHAGCILPWLESHNTCPVCRSPLPRALPPDQLTEGSSDSPASGAPALESSDAPAAATDDTEAAAEEDEEAAGAPEPRCEETTEPELVPDLQAPAPEADGPDTGDAIPVQDSPEGGPEGRDASPGARLSWLGRAAGWIARSASGRMR